MDYDQGPPSPGTQMGWQERLAEEQRLQEFRRQFEAMAAQQQGMGGPGQPPPGRAAPPPISGANPLYGNGKMDYGAVLDTIQGKSGLGRSALMSKTRSF